jgi:amidase
VSAPLTRRPAHELARLVRAGDVSAVEVVDAHLAAIERLNPQLNAVVTLAADAARAAAREVDAKRARREQLPPLAGLPIGIKDESETAGLRTTWGSTLHADHVPTTDADGVARLKRAGAIVIGKTNIPEFAAGANTVNKVFGATRNPWNPALSASGSTGGGAAGLAAGLFPLADGSDFGGSLRTPAAFCGVVGLRTTSGIVPRHPMPLPWHGVNVSGPMARTAEDCALLLDAMTTVSRASPLSRPVPWPSAFAMVRGRTDVRGLRVAFCADMPRIGVDPEIERVCRAAALGLAEDGAIVEEVAFDTSDARDAFVTLRAIAMLGTHFDRLDRLERLNENLAGNIRAGLDVKPIDIARAEKKRAELWHRFRALFERFDVLATPTTPVLPFPVEQNYPSEIAGRKLENYIDWIAPTFAVSLVTLPATSVPAGRSANGLPIGLQIIGPQFSEPMLLAAAKMVERRRPIGHPPHS